MKGIRGISGKNVPIYAWESGAASACMYLFGPEQFGGAGDLLQKVQEIKAENEEERKKEIKRVRLYLFSVPCPISADVSPFAAPTLIRSTTTQPTNRMTATRTTKALSPSSRAWPMCVV